MTRAEAKAEVQKLWDFKEVGGLIAVRDVELIRVAARIEARLGEGPWLVGETFTAADVLVGGLLAWITGWGLLRPGPETARFLSAIEARPARQAAIRKGAAPAGDTP